MKGGAKPPQGLRLNGDKKMQILRAFEDDEAGCYVVYGKKVMMSMYYYTTPCYCHDSYWIY